MFTFKIFKASPAALMVTINARVKITIEIWHVVKEVSFPCKLLEMFANWIKSKCYVVVFLVETIKFQEHFTSFVRFQYKILMLFFIFPYFLIELIIREYIFATNFETRNDLSALKSLQVKSGKGLANENCDQWCWKLQSFVENPSV
jgi:hypothetical protein